MPRHRVPLESLGPDASQFNAGSMQLRRNIAMRQPNMLEPVPGYEEICEVIANRVGRRIWAFETLSNIFELVLWSSAGGSYACRGYDPTDEVTPTVADPTLLGEPCGAFEARDRVFYAGPRGALVFDGDFTEARMLGMLQPTFIAVNSSTTTAAQAVPVNSRVAWRATLHRRDDDDYEITSAPSYAIYAETAGAIRDFTIRVGWVNPGAESDARVREGDILRLWRTRSVASGTSTNDRYLLTAEIELSASNITDRYVDIRDVTPDLALASREELYTNPGIQGALQTNWQLGACSDAAFFNGHGFYAERSLPAYMKLGISSRTGYLGTSVPYNTYGIGTRSVTGTQTNGSPTLTAVSSTVGVVAGQQTAGTVPGGVYPTGANVVSTTVNTITLDTNAASSSAGIGYYLIDMMEINGTPLRFANIQTLLYDAWDNSLPVIILPDAVVDGTGYTPGTGVISFVTVDLDGLELTISSIAPYGESVTDLEISATNGSNYSPALPEYQTSAAPGRIDTRLNRVRVSKLNQPDHVPVANASSELFVGRGEIVRMVETQDRLFVFCTDGAYVITGNSGVWNVDIFDRKMIAASQQAVSEMKGNVYVYAKDRGLLRIDPGGGVSNLTKGALQQQVIEPWITAVVNASDGSYAAHVACDELHDEVGLFFVESGEFDTRADYVLVFNERTQDWRTQTPGIDVADTASDITCWTYSPKRRSVVWVRTNSGGEGVLVPALLKNQVDDDDDTTPIPGATMMTYPIVPDNDPVSLKRFHEVMFTISALDTVAGDGLIFTVSAGAQLVGAVTTAAQALAANPTLTPNVPAFFQLRHMISRQATISGHLVLNFAPDAENLHRWRLHAIDVTWEPASARSYNR